MTKEEAIDAISKDFQEKYENTQMTITLNGKNFKVSIYPVLGLDVKSIVERTYRYRAGYHEGKNRNRSGYGCIERSDSKSNFHRRL